MVVLNTTAPSQALMSSAPVTTTDGPTAAGATPPAKPMYPRLFKKIVLSLENSLLPEDKLVETPSHIDGLDPDTEKDLRILGCELIQTAGILLKLPQVAMATAQVIFQRFFYSKSFVRHNMETVAMSCLCLASKIEEAPRRIRDVINVFHHIKQVRAQRDITPMILDQYYTNVKNQVIKAERRVLKELGFCVHVKHPHKLIVMYLQVLKFETHERLMQMSWNFMNDSLRTDVFLRYHPEAIACACIYLSARKLGIPLPSQPSWYGLFRVPEEDIIDICFRVMELYTRPKPNVEALESAVEELKKRYMESRNKSKEQAVVPAVTTVDRNNGSHNAWGGFIQRTIPLPLPKVEKSPDKDSRSNSHSRSRSRSGSRSSGDGGRGDGGADYRNSKKHRGRSRSRSRTPRSRSRSPRDSMTKGKKSKSRRYSRSPSLSPRSKHRKRKSSHGRERVDYYASGGGGGTSKERNQSMNDKYRDKYQERDSSRHRPSHRSGYSHGENSGTRGGGGNGGGGASRSGGHKHRERDRDHDRDRDRYRSRDRKR